MLARKIVLNTIQWKKNNQKIYAATIQQDLLGWWTVCCAWSGLHYRRGGGKVYAYQTRQEAEKFIIQLKKRRAMRGYKEQGTQDE